MSDAAATASLGADDLRRIARASREAQAAQHGECECGVLRCAGWESLPASFDTRRLVRLGRVASVRDDDPYAETTLVEHHPGGTRYASPDAPIATGHFPVNRSEVWACADCGRAFLRYTEYGGYYVDHRIRELDEALIVETVPPAVG